MIGHVRKCPKCGQPIRIEPDAPAVPESVPIEEAPADEQGHAAAPERLPAHRLPERLDRDGLYLITNRTQLLALWQSDGRGWMLKTGNSYVTAKRNRDRLPTEGDFKLTELKFTVTPEGKHLSGIISYQLLSRWALTVLDEGDDQIVRKITGLGSLNREQKFAVRQVLKEQYMPDVFEHSAEVLDYLSNTDYRSPGVGVKESEPAGPPRLSLADFLGAVVFVDARPPKEFDFGFHVFQDVNPQAAESIADRQSSGGPLITVQNLGSFGLTDTGFVEHAHELAHEDPEKSHEKCTLVFQEHSLTVASGGKYHTVLCSYFRAREAKDVVLPAGESLDSLLR